MKTFIGSVVLAAIVACAFAQEPPLVPNSSPLTNLTSMGSAVTGGSGNLYNGLTIVGLANASNFNFGYRGLNNMLSGSQSTNRLLIRLVSLRVHNAASPGGYFEPDQMFFAPKSGFNNSQTTDGGMRPATTAGGQPIAGTEVFAFDQVGRYVNGPYLPGTTPPPEDTIFSIKTETLIYNSTTPFYGVDVDHPDCAWKMIPGSSLLRISVDTIVMRQNFSELSVISPDAYITMRLDFEAWRSHPTYGNTAFYVTTVPYCTVAVNQTYTTRWYGLVPFDGETDPSFFEPAFYLKMGHWIHITNGTHDELPARYPVQLYEQNPPWVSNSQTPPRPKYSPTISFPFAIASQLRYAIQIYPSSIVNTTYFSTQEGVVCASGVPATPEEGFCPLVTPPSETPGGSNPDAEDNTTGVIIGATFGGFLALVLLLLVCSSSGMFGSDGDSGKFD